MLAYGLGNAVQDGWNEQLWKRGSVDHHIESVLRPELSLGWLTSVVGAAAVYGCGSGLRVRDNRGWTGAWSSSASASTPAPIGSTRCSRSRATDRGGGQRTLVWVEGVAEPIVASRTERTILHDMGQEAAAGSPLLDEALALAERLAEDAASGRVDLADLGRRARKLLESSSTSGEASQLF